ncbi:MAG: hypothetical protein IH863_07995, partial [Chloroflexi bacterium]|nr:hypothetical protein [Chloroflexota bacterium]
MILIVLLDSVNAAADWIGDAAVYLANLVTDMSGSDVRLVITALLLLVALLTFYLREYLLENRRRADDLGNLRSTLSA